jgi:hypothetical protein
MKKYFAFAAAAIMMVACNVEELKTSDVQENGTISLSASINSADDATRAKSADALQNQLFVSGKTIFVEAYETGASTPYTSGTYTTGAAGALTGGLYYPANNGAIDICAYYPSDITRSSTSFAVQTNQASEANYQASDLMYATKLTEKSSGTTHDLTFNHALTKIVVIISLHASITNENLTTHPTVTAVAINSTKPNATLSITNGAITISGVTGDAADISIMGTGLDNMGIIVPQTVAANADFITISYNSAAYTYKLPEAKTFAAGKVYTYELTLTARGLELQATTITNWDPQTGGSHGITI